MLRNTVGVMLQKGSDFARNIYLDLPVSEW